MNKEVMKLFDLSGKVALVTGAGSGLGRAIAEAMAEAGADVVCVGRTKEKLEETANIIRKLGRKALVLQADVSKEDDVKHVFEETIKHTRAQCS